MSGEAKAIQPKDATRLVAERLNAGDAAGVAAQYEPGAVLAYPADRPVTGGEAIQAICQKMAGAAVKFAIETPLPTVRFENLALTSTRLAGRTGSECRSCAARAKLVAADHRSPRGPPAIKKLAAPAPDTAFRLPDGAHAAAHVSA
jgi:ketosteroid isomerase-like protein